MAHEGHKHPGYVSDASRIVGTYSPKVRSHSAASMADAGRAFVASLDKSQRDKVLEELTSTEREKWTNLPQKSGNGGLALGKCNEEQMNALKQEFSEMKFGWRGGTTNGDDIYYSLQGPTLLIEYAAQDREANHIRTIYRDPTNVYGKQLEGK